LYHFAILSVTSISTQIDVFTGTLSKVFITSVYFLSLLRTHKSISLTQVESTCFFQFSSLNIAKLEFISLAIIRVSIVLHLSDILCFSINSLNFCQIFASHFFKLSKIL